MILAQNRHIDKWKRTGSPEINTWVYGQQLFDKGAKHTRLGKNRL